MSATIINFPGVNKAPVVRTMEDTQSVQKLAEGVMWTLNMINDKRFVFILGDGSEGSNKEAVESWIINQYDLDDIYAMDNAVRELSRALMAYLDNHRHEFEV